MGWVKGECSCGFGGRVAQFTLLGVCPIKGGDMGWVCGWSRMKVRGFNDLWR